MRFLAHALAVLSLAACAAAPNDSEPSFIAAMPEPDGPPPAMGSVTLTGDGASQVLTTYDFSVGAFDASAWFGPGNAGGAKLTITAYPDRNPQAETGLLRIEAALTALPERPAVTGAALVQILDRTGTGKTILWSNLGRTTWLEVSTYAREDGAAYGEVTGRFKTTLCDMATPERNDCHEVTGTFQTRVQFDGI